MRLLHLQNCHREKSFTNLARGSLIATQMGHDVVQRLVKAGQLRHGRAFSEGRAWAAHKIRWLGWLSSIIGHRRLCRGWMICAIAASAHKHTLRDKSHLLNLSIQQKVEVATNDTLLLRAAARISALFFLLIIDHSVVPCDGAHFREGMLLDLGFALTCGRHGRHVLLTSRKGRSHHVLRRFSLLWGLEQCLYLHSWLVGRDLSLWHILRLHSNLAYLLSRALCVLSLLLLHDSRLSWWCRHRNIGRLCWLWSVGSASLSQFIFTMSEQTLVSILACALFSPVLAHFVLQSFHNGLRALWRGFIRVRGARWRGCCSSRLHFFGA